MALTSTQPPSEHQKILVVDDNTHGLAARKSVLEELGYDVTTTSTPLKALDEFQSREFDLLITDFRMPKLTGVELIQKVRVIKPNLPVLLISGFVDTLGLNEENTGADVVLQKSANEVQQMVRSVNRLLRRKSSRKPPGSARGSSSNRKRKDAG
jgi:CheY-like chemotaxis protein